MEDGEGGVLGLSLVVPKTHVEGDHAAEAVRVVGINADRANQTARMPGARGVSVRWLAAIEVEVIVDADNRVATAGVVLNAQLDIVAPAHELIGQVRDLSAHPRPPRFG